MTQAVRGSLVALSLGLALGGCSTPLDNARLAWDDGDGDLEQADELYREALGDPRLEPLAREELYDIYLELGDEATKAKKALKAQEYYEKALEMEPKSDEALSGLARAFRDMMKYDEALAVAIRGMESGCTNCRRLYAVLLIRRADAFMEAQQWAEAEQDYTAALAIIPDASLALATVRARYGRKDVDGAAQGLREAVGLIGGQDLEGRRQFLELRRAVVLLALQEEKTELADEMLDLAPTGVGGEEQLGLAIEVAMEFRRQGKPDEGLTRLLSLADAAARGKVKLSPERLEELRDRVAIIYAARASQRLAQGDNAGAKEDLDEAIGMKPDEPSFKLQQVLLTAANGKLPAALAQLAKVDASAKGHKEVSAILASLEVDRLVGAGRTADAQAELARAKKLAPELPEVHLATAQVLAVTEPEGLTKADTAKLRKGLVRYPGGRITRVGEALSEVDWCRQQMRGLGTSYEYRAPGADKRLSALAEQLAFYTLPVKFLGEPKAVLVLKAEAGAALTVSVAGGGADGQHEIPAGGSARVTIPTPGLVELTTGGGASALLAEPYTEVEVSL